MCKVGIIIARHLGWVGGLNTVLRVKRLEKEFAKRKHSISIRYHLTTAIVLIITICLISAALTPFLSSEACDGSPLPIKSSPHFPQHETPTADTSLSEFTTRTPNTFPHSIPTTQKALHFPPLRLCPIFQGLAPGSLPDCSISLYTLSSDLLP